ncbi:hypothetical protein KAYACHO_75 [Mycobacterium phage KayaCho]|uniref:hypothetical protein n=1 Tax=Mycobacterium phage KayaCho TaxID=1340830 RepID=UPI000387F8AA|nr:hypothetical protein N846_gp75 [Mycobacterium phage KayaCho]AGT12979.1 hypothetical protein KAYACHO_75 [Mycobacterium phage KayaCho]
MTPVPTRADVARLNDADAAQRGLAGRSAWVLVWCPPQGRWRLVFDPPSRAAR